VFLIAEVVERDDAWKDTSAAVDERGGNIFVQLMHCGRVAHGANLPAGAEVLGPGRVACSADMYTDALGSTVCSSSPVASTARAPNRPSSTNAAS